MPELENFVFNKNEREEKFSHSNDIAKPNYYKVKSKNQIQTEIAPSERGAHIRFSYPKGKKGFLYWMDMQVLVA